MARSRAWSQKQALSTVAKLEELRLASSVLRQKGSLTLRQLSCLDPGRRSQRRIVAAVTIFTRLLCFLKLCLGDLRHALSRQNTRVSYMTNHVFLSALN
jgi:hypothetical protein